MFTTDLPFAEDFFKEVQGMSLSEFQERLRFATENAAKSQKELEENGIVFLPNGSVIVHPNKNLKDFGYTLVKDGEGFQKFGAVSEAKLSREQVHSAVDRLFDDPWMDFEDSE